MSGNCCVACVVRCSFRLTLTCLLPSRACPPRLAAFLLLACASRTRKRACFAMRWPWTTGRHRLLARAGATWSGRSGTGWVRTLARRPHWSKKSLAPHSHAITFPQGTFCPQPSARCLARPCHARRIGQPCCAILSVASLQSQRTECESVGGSKQYA